MSLKLTLLTYLIPGLASALAIPMAVGLVPPTATMASVRPRLSHLAAFGTRQIASAATVSPSRASPRSATISSSFTSILTGLPTQSSSLWPFERGLPPDGPGSLGYYVRRL